MSKIAYIGLDDGNFNTKLVAILEENGVRSNVIQLSIPTRIAHGAVAQINGLKGVANNSSIYEFNGSKYTVLDSNDKSMHSNIIDPRNLVYHSDVANVIMAKHIIKLAGIDSTYDLRITSGLPFRDYFTLDGEVNKAVLQDKIDNFNFKWDDIICADGSMINKPIAHNVLSEGAGSYLNEIFNYDGSDSINEITTKLSNAPVSFVDIGGRTIDIVTFTQNGQKIINDYSETSEYGALDLNNELAKSIRQELGIKSQILADKIDDALNTGKYLVRGESVDISETIKRAKRGFATRIEQEIRKTLRHADDIGLIVFVGGGSLLIQEELSEIYHQTYFIKEPEFANAKGFLKGCMWIFNE